MTVTKAQLAQRVHSLEQLSTVNTAEIRSLHAVIANRDAQIVTLSLLNQVVADCEEHIAVLKDFIDTQDEMHADEMALLNHLNEAVNERLGREISARHKCRAQGIGQGITRRDAQADGAQADSMGVDDAQCEQRELMGRVRLLVAAQAYEILAGYGVHYRELAHTIGDCLEALKEHHPHDPKEPILKAMQSIKSACHTLADNIAACRAGGIHENFGALWPGSLEAVEVPAVTPTGTLRNSGFRGKCKRDNSRDKRE